MTEGAVIGRTDWVLQLENCVKNENVAYLDTLLLKLLSNCSEVTTRKQCQKNWVVQTDPLRLLNPILKSLLL